jgi:hypothetical protein
MQPGFEGSMSKVRLGFSFYNSEKVKMITISSTITKQKGGDIEIQSQ